MKPAAPPREYVRKAQEDGRRYAEHQAIAVHKLELLISSLEAARAKLQDEVATLRELLVRRDQQDSQLSQQMAEIIQDNRRLTGEYLEVERQHSCLANLFTAAIQLHDSLDRGQVLQAIQEIVIGLVGCEELVILAVDPTGVELRPIAWFGVDGAAFRPVALGLGLIGRAAVSGQVSLRGCPENDPSGLVEEAAVTACVPLRVEGRVTGVLVLFRLLAHKARLEEADRELLELLADQAGAALYCAELNGKRRQEGR